MAIRTVSATLLGLSSVLLLAGCNQRDPQAVAMGAVAPAIGSVDTSAPARTLAQTPFERLWTLDMPAPVHACWQDSQVPGLLLFQLQTRELVAVDAMSGFTRWVTQPLPGLVTLRPDLIRRQVPGLQANEMVNEDRLFLVSSETLYCIDLAGGQVVWRYELPFSPSTGPCAVGGEDSLKVFMGDWRGYIRVVSFHPEKQIPYIAWQYNLGATVVGTPVDSEQTVTFGDLNGRVHAFTPDREQKWDFPAGGPVAAPTAPLGQLLFVGNQDHILFVLNRLTGLPLGQLNLLGPITRQPMLFDEEPERAFVWIDAEPGVPGGLASIYAKHDFVPFTIDPQKPPREVVRLAQEWFIPGVDRLVTSTPQHLYLGVAGQPQRVMAVNRVSGRVEWTADLAIEEVPGRSGGSESAPPVFVAAHHDSRDQVRSIIMASSKGRVACHRYFGYVPGRADQKAFEAAMAAKPAEPKQPPKSKRAKAAEAAKEGAEGAVPAGEPKKDAAKGE